MHYVKLIKSMKSILQSVLTEYMHIVCVRVCMDLDIYREKLYGIINDKDN